MYFPKNFSWGAATSSYQIEGAANTDGRGSSVWDLYCRRPGMIHDGSNGDTACDHYGRYREDVALMQSMGLGAYRFSIAWSRVLPTGRGPVNAPGLAFYDRLVDALLEAGITPWATLFHWDFPTGLYREGGWLHPDSPQWFADYAAVMVEKLSDRVTHWLTLNEPQCFIGLGHHTGIHAPGDKLALPLVLKAAQNALLAHGRAVQVIRSRAKLPPRVGWAPTTDVPIPLTESSADVSAAREAFHAVAPQSVWNTAWWLDAVHFGRYPEQGLQAYGADAPAVSEEELRLMNQPLDFLGLNLYRGNYCRRGEGGKTENVPAPLGSATTHNHWGMCPETLHWGPLFAYERYRLPIVITENGMAGHDWVALDDRVHDSHRIDYMQRHLAQLARAIERGVPVEGYFAWSLLDNFEWSEGYRYRFGLVHVDFATQQRRMKESAFWYRDFIRSQRSAVGGEPAPVNRPLTSAH